jgi:hypothetical protein
VKEGIVLLPDTLCHMRRHCKAIVRFCGRWPGYAALFLTSLAVPYLPSLMVLPSHDFNYQNAKDVVSNVELSELPVRNGQNVDSFSTATVAGQHNPCLLSDGCMDDS